MRLPCSSISIMVFFPRSPLSPAACSTSCFTFRIFSRNRSGVSSFQSSMDKSITSLDRQKIISCSSLVSRCFRYSRNPRASLFRIYSCFAASCFRYQESRHPFRLSCSFPWNILRISSATQDCRRKNACSIRALTRSSSSAAFCKSASCPSSVIISGIRSNRNSLGFSSLRFSRFRNRSVFLCSSLGNFPVTMVYFGRERYHLCMFSISFIQRFWRLNAIPSPRQDCSSVLKYCSFFPLSGSRYNW